MSDKKNIDRLFREKLKNFEATPSDSVWENVSTELENIDQGKKGIPVWWKVAGIAAAVLLLFTISQLVSSENTPFNSRETIVDVDSKKDVLNNEVEKVSDAKNTISDPDQINDNEVLQSEASTFKSQSSETNTITTDLQAEIVNKDPQNNNVIVSSNIKKDDNNISNINKKALVVSSSEQTKNADVNNTLSNLSNDKTKIDDIDKAKVDAFLNSPKDNSSGTKETLKTSLADETVGENITESEESSEIKEEDMTYFDE